jgi:uncharacterized protein (DUF885 family)
MLILFALPPGPSAFSAPADDLAALFHEAWEARLRDDPLFATHAGDNRYNALLPVVSVEEADRQAAQTRRFLERLKGIDRAGLPTADQESYDVFRRLLEDDLAEHSFKGYLLPITNREGFHVSFAELPRDVPLDTVEDYENYIARLTAFGRFADEHVAVMREGIQAGLTLPADVMHGYDEPIEAHVVDDPTKSVLYGPFKKFPSPFSDEDRLRLTEAGQEAIVKSVVPGYQRFLHFMRNEYVPACRGTIACSALPKGRDWYRNRVRHFTTLDLSPEEVHELGQSEVRRIRAEMDQVIKKTGFPGDFAAFCEDLRTNPRFYPESPDDLLKEVAYVLKKMDGELPHLFKRLPRAPYGIREIPLYIAPNTTTAYYSPSAGDGSRAGFYYVNTFNLKARPLYEVEALSLHEAVPGHHLQIALAQEIEGLPEFRRYAGFTAFVEGWALYSERLGLETGFYQDPYSDFGRLSYEMWRACRLVVDTGMHYLGWTRAQSIDFMRTHSAMTELNITNEVDRYIAWPGQALAYKVGELKIRELRARAEERLGEEFDVREFHDVVLSSGAVPLDVLEANVDAYLADRTRESARPAR